MQAALAHAAAPAKPLTPCAGRRQAAGRVQARLGGGGGNFGGRCAPAAGCGPPCAQTGLHACSNRRVPQPPTALRSAGARSAPRSASTPPTAARARRAPPTCRDDPRLIIPGQGQQGPGQARNLVLPGQQGGNSPRPGGGLVGAGMPTPTQVDAAPRCGCLPASRRHAWCGMHLWARPGPLCLPLSPGRLPTPLPSQTTCLPDRSPCPPHRTFGRPRGSWTWRGRAATRRRRA